MNSRLYEYYNRGNWEFCSGFNEDVWSEVKFVNFGIIKGLKRSSGVDESDSAQCGLEELGQLHKDLYESCPSSVWEGASDLFIKYNRSTLDDYKYIPWFLPQWLGGVGLIDTRGSISHGDLLDASIVRMHLNNEDSKLKIQSISNEVQWRTHKAVKSSVKEFEFLETCCYGSLIRYPLREERASLEGNWNDIYSHLTATTLWGDCKNNYDGLTGLDIDELKAKNYQHYVVRTLRRNEKVFKRCRRFASENPHIKPMKLDDLIYERRKSFIPCYM
jgi:hypothetical protein